MHDYTEISPVIKIERHRCVVLHSVQGCVMKWKIVLDVSRSWPSKPLLTASTSISLIGKEGKGGGGDSHSPERRMLLCLTASSDVN